MTRVGSLPLRFRQGPLSTPGDGLCTVTLIAPGVQRLTSVHIKRMRKGCARGRDFAALAEKAVTPQVFRLTNKQGRAQWIRRSALREGGPEFAGCL
jgi:hypothetical protein